MSTYLPAELRQQLVEVDEHPPVVGVVGGRERLRLADVRQAVAGLRHVQGLRSARGLQASVGPERVGLLVVMATRSPQGTLSVRAVRSQPLLAA